MHMAPLQYGLYIHRHIWYTGNVFLIIVFVLGLIMISCWSCIRTCRNVLFTNKDPLEGQTQVSLVQEEVENRIAINTRDREHDTYTSHLGTRSQAGQNPNVGDIHVREPRAPVVSVHQPQDHRRSGTGSVEREPRAPVVSVHQPQDHRRSGTGSVEREPRAPVVSVHQPQDHRRSGTGSVEREPRAPVVSVHQPQDHRRSGTGSVEREPRAPVVSVHQPQDHRRSGTGSVEPPPSYESIFG